MKGRKLTRGTSLLPLDIEVFPYRTSSGSADELIENYEHMENIATLSKGGKLGEDKKKYYSTELKKWGIK